VSPSVWGEAVFAADYGVARTDRCIKKRPQERPAISKKVNRKSDLWTRKPAASGRISHEMGDLRYSRRTRQSKENVWAAHRYQFDRAHRERR